MSHFVYLFSAYFVIVTLILVYLLRNAVILTRLERKVESWYSSKYE